MKAFLVRFNAYQHVKTHCIHTAKKKHATGLPWDVGCGRGMGWDGMGRDVWDPVGQLWDENVQINVRKFISKNIEN